MTFRWMGLIGQNSGGGFRVSQARDSYAMNARERGSTPLATTGSCDAGTTANSAKGAGADWYLCATASRDCAHMQGEGEKDSGFPNRSTAPQLSGGYLRIEPTDRR